MTDPFSIIVGTAGLLDISVRVVKFLKKVQASDAKVEKSIAMLLHEIEALLLVNKTLEDFWTAKGKASLPTGLSDPNYVHDLWRNAGIILADCKNTVEKLEVLVKSIIGTVGIKVTGKIDSIKKQLRKESKEGDLEQLRRGLSRDQNILQLLLTALNLVYTRSSQDSTDISFDHLSEDVEQLGLKLESQIASLRPQIRWAEDDKLRDSITSAAAVATAVSSNKHFYIPQTVSSIFTGRESLLEELKAAFDISSSSKGNGTQKRFIIHGLAGSGKTQFCCKFAQDNRQNFWGIFYVDASSHENAKHAFSRIAKVGGVEPNERAAMNWLSNLEHPWLLLIDNADNRHTSIEEYFPAGEQGYILVTTRNDSNAVYGTVGRGSYYFGEFDADEADTLLLKAAHEPSPWDPSTKRYAASITKALGYLPLALVHAGSAIRSGLCALENYLDFYERSLQRIRRARHVIGFKKDESLNMNVYSSYEIIYQGLEDAGTEASRDAIELLKTFSFLHRENIGVTILIKAITNPREEREYQEEQERKKNTTKSFSRAKSWSQYLRELAIKALEGMLKDRSRPILPTVLRELDECEGSRSVDDLRLRIALRELSEKSLITRQETTDRYSMHPLVHTWARERPQMSTGEQAIWCQAATTILTRCIFLPPLGSEESDEELYKDLLPHVDHVQRCQKTIRTRLIENQKLRRRPWPVLVSRFYETPEDQIQTPSQALQTAKFSQVYSQCGLWNDAEKLQLAVRDYILKKRGIEHPAAIAITLALSATYWQQSRTNDAAELQSQVLQACTTSQGPNHPQTLKVMDTLGNSRCFQGRYKEALTLHETAIEGMTKTLGEDHEDTLVAVDNLGRLMWRYFRYDEARDLHLKAIDGMKRVLGPTDHRTLTAMEGLAITYLEMGGDLLKTAHELMIDVLNHREKKLGKEQPYTLLATCNLARIKSALGQNNEAEKLMRHALPIAQRNLGKDHFGTLAGEVYFAQVLARQQRFGEAEDMLVHVVERQRYVSAARDDGEHPDRIMALWYLLQCYQLQAKFGDAIRICDVLEKSVSTIGGQGLGLLHPFAKRLSDKRKELEAACTASTSEALTAHEPKRGKDQLQEAQYALLV